MFSCNCSVFSLRRVYTWIKPDGVDTGIKIYNPITKNKDPLICKKNKIVSFYSCGPTVYNDSHIGHASSYVRLDIVRRILSHWFSVKPVVALGITDIDNKILARASSFNIEWNVLAKKYELEFFADMERLNILQPHFVMRVTEHIPDIVAYIETIIKNGNGYELNGDVYFNTQSISHYGKVTRAPIVEPEESRPESYKKNKADFVLWKSATPKEPSWPSPWGAGRPGWHIECSTMASKIFQDKVDIHTGGLDLAFPHHENEEAQSCAYHCTPQWVNYWIHTGHLLMNGWKMSKSMKNFVTISKFLENYTSDHFRMLCLLSHYRTSIDYSSDVMVKAVAVLNKFSTFLLDARNYQRGVWSIGDVSSSRLLEIVEKTKKKMMKSLSDDFNTVLFMSDLEELVKEANIMLHADLQVGAGREPAAMAATADFVEECLQSMGLLSTKQMTDPGDVMNPALDASVDFRRVIREIALSMPNSEERNQLLLASDSLRKSYAALGINIKDLGKSDSSWSREPS